jgi:protein phosphatase
VQAKPVQPKPVQPKPVQPKVEPAQGTAPARVGGDDDDDVEITQITAFPSAELARARALARGEEPGPAITSAAMPAGGEEDAPQPSRVELSYEAEAETDEVTSPTVRILVTAIGDSDQGRMRSRNEDSLIAFPQRSLFAVADGMGGHAAGDVASAVAVDVLRDAFERNLFSAHTESNVEVPRRGRELACAIQMANEAIYSLAESDPNLKGMGTTLVAARFSPNKQRVYIGHVGDSRCYRLRNSTFRQLTEDHTMSSLGVQGPRSHDLFQAVGVGLTIAIDLIVDRPQGEDLYLLCSDGLSKMVSDELIRQVLLAEPDIEAAVYRLMELANDSGGKDNITLILIKVIDRPALGLRAPLPAQE